MKELPSMDTKHLVIYCSSADCDPDSVTYSEDEAPWRYPWYITLKNMSSTLVGIFRFDGPPVNGRVLLKVDEDRNYIDSSYAEEALNEICTWVFSQKDAVAVMVHHIPDDERYLKLLKTCGFVLSKKDPTVALKKKSASIWKTTFIGAGICIGIAVFSLIFPDSIKALWGVFPGAIVGFIAGFIMDLREAKHIESVLHGSGQKPEENNQQ